MVFDALRGGERRAGELAAEAKVLAYDAHSGTTGYTSDRRTTRQSTMTMRSKREIVREEEVLHPDTGPREPDISRLQAFETMDADHFRARKGRKRH